MLRHLRLLMTFAKFSLQGEMAFRGNYLIKIVVEVLWLCLMVLFYQILFKTTNDVAGWSKHEYFFFLGCFYALEGIMETLFLGNFGEFAEMVRSGNLDIVLLQPVDEQVVVSFRKFEWSTVPNVLFGTVMMGLSAWNLGISFEFARITSFAVGMVSAFAIAYSFMLMLASTSVWLVRNQSLYEIWWLFTSLMRYPKEIFNTAWAAPVGWFFSFIVPVLLAVNVPASSMVKALEPVNVVYACGSATVLLIVSRWVFRRALRSYRSASS
jgi:ABC-2 type transport system permease protein